MFRTKGLNVNLQAVQSMFELMPDLGAENEPLKAALLSLARQVDEKPDSPGLWAEYRRMLEMLGGVLSGSDDGDFYDGLAGVGNPADSIA